MKEDWELASKVKELLIFFTGWEFQIQRKGDSYMIGITLENKQKNYMVVYFVIEQDTAKIIVIASGCKCTLDYVEEKVKALKLRFKVNVMELRKSTFALEKTIGLQDLDQRLHSIVREQMPVMMEILTEVIYENAE